MEITGADYDENGDAWVGNTKYRRMKKSDADFAAHISHRGSVFYVFVDNSDYAVVPALHINLSSELWTLVDEGDNGESGKPDNGKPDDGNSNNENVTVAKTSIFGIQAEAMGFTVKWNQQTTASGYQVQHSTNKKFTSGAKTKTITVKWKKATSKIVSKLKAKKKYYVKIRTYKIMKINGKSKKVYSDWSKVRAVTTKK